MRCSERNFAQFSNRAKNKPNNKKEPNEIFGSQAQKKGAKIDKFVAERAKLATLTKTSSNNCLLIVKALIIPMYCPIRGCDENRILNNQKKGLKVVQNH